MSVSCKVYCAGSVKAPYNWITSVPLGINRIVYINGGCGGYVQDDIKIPFKQGCLYLFPGNAGSVATYSSYESDEKRLDHSYVNFELVPPIVSKEVFCLDCFEDIEIKAAVEAFKALCLQSTLKNEFENLSEASQKFLKSTVLFLVDIIAEKYNCQTVKDEVIIHALKLMHEKIGRHQAISDIAEACYLSTDGFIRRFKKQMGETPYAYLKKLKLRTAQNMRLAGASLKEIAEKCGYSDSCALLHALGKTQKQTGGHVIENPSKN